MPPAREVRHTDTFVHQKRHLGDFSGSDDLWKYVDLVLSNVPDSGHVAYRGTDRVIRELPLDTALGQLSHLLWHQPQ